MLTLADVNEGVTVGGRVTLLILTPRPRGEGEPAQPILGPLANTWVSQQQGDGSPLSSVRPWVTLNSNQFKSLRAGDLLFGTYGCARRTSDCAEHPWHRA